jgi:hypothetical protein
VVSILDKINSETERVDPPPADFLSFISHPSSMARSSTAWKRVLADDRAVCAEKEGSKGCMDGGGGVSRVCK